MPRQAVGRRLNGADFADVGAFAGRHYRCCFKVVAMGDRNGVAYAQEVHEHVLRSAGLLPTNQTLRYGEALPKTSLLEGVYVDDLAFCLKTSLSRRGCWPGHDPSCLACKKDGGMLPDVEALDVGHAGNGQA